MRRRGFLQALIAGSTAAVAAHFGVAEALVPEIKDELRKDLRKSTVIGMPGVHPWEGNNALWWSTGLCVDTWMQELQRQHGGRLNGGLLRQSCRRMAMALDADAMTARVKHDQKVVVEIPKLRIKTAPPRVGLARLQPMTGTIDHFDLVAGLETKQGLWGPRYRVGYIQEKVWTPDQEQVDESKRVWTGLS